jgi:5-methylcytosine-specific restriction endonuclease McrA
MANTQLGSLFADIFREEQRQQNVWEKGHPIPGRDKNVWRYDDFGSVILRGAYGDRSSPWGWEIDHILAKRLGGSDDLWNLRPLHCRTNASLGGVLGRRV